MRRSPEPLYSIPPRRLKEVPASLHLHAASETGLIRFGERSGV